MLKAAATWLDFVPWLAVELLQLRFHLGYLFLFEFCSLVYGAQIQEDQQGFLIAKYLHTKETNLVSISYQIRYNLVYLDNGCTRYAITISGVAAVSTPADASSQVAAGSTPADATSQVETNYKISQSNKPSPKKRRRGRPRKDNASTPATNSSTQPQIATRRSR